MRDRHNESIRYASSIATRLIVALRVDYARIAQIQIKKNSQLSQ